MWIKDDDTCETVRVTGNTPLPPGRPKTFPYECDNQRDKSKAIMKIVQQFGIDDDKPVCKGS